MNVIQQATDYTVSSLASLTRKLLTEESSNLDLKESLIKYLSETGDNESIEIFTQIYPKAHPKLKAPIVIALARLSPQSAIVGEWIKGFEEDKKPTADDMRDSLLVMFNLSKRSPYARGFFGDDPGLDKRVELAKRIAMKLQRLELYIFYSSDMRRDYGSLYFAVSKDAGTYYGFDEGAIVGEGGKVINSLSRDYIEKNALSELNDLLERFCIREGKRLTESRTIISALGVDMKEEASILTVGGVEVDKSTANGTLILLPGANNTPQILWRDELGVLRKDSVAKFSELSKCQIKLVERQELKFEK
ncbi:MAG: hypothetical protein WA081_07770 [Desulfosalsimonadaceae bacterium]